MDKKGTKFLNIKYKLNKRLKTIINLQLLGKIAFMLSKAKKSIIQRQNIAAIIQHKSGTILYLNEVIKSPFNNAFTLLVFPQAGQSHPVTS